MRWLKAYMRLKNDDDEKNPHLLERWIDGEIYMGKDIL